jgi:cytochrome c oxidase cbb3-type subunit 3
MPTKIEKDAISGKDTTGHEWDGIKELDTPLPRWWLNVFYACIAFAVVWSILYPSWPGIHGYFHGLLGYSQRQELDKSIQAAAAAHADMRRKIAESTITQVAADHELSEYALAGGKAVFANNCAVCHGVAGSGRPNYPILADDKWLWGGKLTDIYQSVQHGVRSPDDPDTRTSAMPHFGADKMLKDTQIEDVASYVRVLAKLDQPSDSSQRGQAIFKDQCAPCHGAGGQGSHDVGAPSLTDGIWLYSGTKEGIEQQVTLPKQGVMPAWVRRLDDVDIKMVALYVHELGGGE